MNLERHPFHKIGIYHQVLPILKKKYLSSRGDFGGVTGDLERFRGHLRELQSIFRQFQKCFRESQARFLRFEGVSWHAFQGVPEQHNCSRQDNTYMNKFSITHLIWSARISAFSHTFAEIRGFSGKFQTTCKTFQRRYRKVQTVPTHYINEDSSILILNQLDCYS